MVQFHEVLPYVPSAALMQVSAAGAHRRPVAPGNGSEHETPPPQSPQAFPRKLSCAGDFADPWLNQELRRFLMRDALSLIIVVVGALLVTLTAGAMFADVDAVSQEVIVASLGAAVGLAVGSTTDAVAFFRGDHTRPIASAWRLFASGCVAVSIFFLTGFSPSLAAGSCTTGDLGVVNGTATDAGAIARRQRYCFDRINPWPACYLSSLFVLRRLYPQHGVPMLVVLLVTYVCDTLFIRSAPTDALPHEVRAGTVIADSLAVACVVVVSAVYCTRFHALGRARFIATVEAERARHLAIAEMKEVDALLQRALPATVLERLVSAGAEIRDETDLATISIANIAGFSAYSHVAGEAAAVSALHAFAVAADALLVQESRRVEKIKTTGDCYCVVSGLPEAVDCHASAACRFGRDLMFAAAQLSTKGNNSAAGQERGPEGGGVATAVDGDRDDGWGSKALRLCVGVHCGKAFGGVLGTQRLSYEVYGEAYDGAQAVVFSAPPGRVTISDTVRRRLTIEASLYAAATNSQALFASPEDVHAATTQLDDVNGGAIVRYTLSSASAGIASGRMGEVLVRSRLTRADTAAVCTHSVVTGFTGAGSEVGQWTAERMLAQRAGLELQLEFILQLAVARQEERNQRRRLRATAVARQRTTAPRRPNRAIGTMPHHEVFAAGSDAYAAETEDVVSPAPQRRNDAADGPNGDAADSAAAPDVEATKALAILEDAVNGPFKRGSRVPLVYSFADDLEEAGYARWVDQHTLELRRDMRFVTLLMVLAVSACYVAVGSAADKSELAIACFAVSVVLGSVNAGLTAAGKFPRSDQPLAYACFSVFALGVIVGNGVNGSGGDHVVTNDVWWLFPFQVFFIDAAAFTASPLVRSLIGTVFALATLLPGIAQDQRAHDFVQQAVFGLSGIVTLPYMRYLFDKLLRWAFIETRVAAMLRLQQDDAQRARDVMLLGLVPPHAVKPLQQWLEVGSPGPLTEAHVAMVVCHVSLRGFTAPTDGGPGLSLLDAHRAMDAILDTCPHLTKVRMAGHSVTLAGPFPQTSPHRRGGVDGGRAEACVAGPDTTSSADLGAALCDALRVVSSAGQVGIIVDAGIDVGRLMGAVVGNWRLSYDVYGPSVQTAQRVAEALLVTTDVPTPHRGDEDDSRPAAPMLQLDGRPTSANVAMTNAAYDAAVSLALRSSGEMAPTSSAADPAALTLRCRSSDRALIDLVASTAASVTSSGTAGKHHWNGSVTLAMQQQPRWRMHLEARGQPAVDACPVASILFTERHSSHHPPAP